MRKRLKDVIFYLEDVEEHPEKYVFASKLITSNSPHQYMKRRPPEFLKEEFERWLAERWRGLPEQLTAPGIIRTKTRERRFDSKT